MIVKPLDLSNLLRDAFLAGRGLKDGDKLSDEDQAAWMEYDPSRLKAYDRLSALSLAAISADRECPENTLEDAAKAAFVKAQSVYRADHDHFPLKWTWETTTERIRDGWRAIAYSALEAAETPPLGTRPLAKAEAPEIEGGSK